MRFVQDPREPIEAELGDLLGVAHRRQMPPDYSDPDIQEEHSERINSLAFIGIVSAVVSGVLYAAWRIWKLKHGL
jgi:hypothetical protein